MIYLIIYDITNDNLRSKVSKLLVKEGAERLQLSVFVTHFNPVSSKLWQKLNTLLESSEEKLLIIPLLKRNFLNTKIIGTLENEIDYLAGDINSLTI